MVPRVRISFRCWRLWVRCPSLSVVIFLINLWCSFCPLLYIFCAEEFQPVILILKKSCFGTINTKAVNPLEVLIRAVQFAHSSPRSNYGPLRPCLVLFLLCVFICCTHTSLTFLFPSMRRQPWQGGSGGTPGKGSGLYGG